MRDFLAIADQIVRDEPGLAACLPVIEKELLHVEILRAMHQAGHLRRLTFKGGTCLRLCHGGLRFSEDLDFSGGSAFDPVLLADIENVLRARVEQRYGLEVTVASPAHVDGRTRSVSRWVARIVTRPARRDSRLGVQRIKLEIDDREAPPDVAPLPIRQRHALLADDFATFPIQAAPMADICTDKMVAYPMSVLTRDNPRHRDVWDIAWITERLDAGAASLAARAADKVAVRGLGARMPDALRLTAERSDALIESEGFRATLQRFVPLDVAVRTVGDPRYRQRLAETIRGICGSLLAALSKQTGGSGP